LTPLRTYTIRGRYKREIYRTKCVLLDQFTIADDKVLLIEIFEKNGGRHQTLAGGKFGFNQSSFD
jgi:hypothetical protein